MNKILSMIFLIVAGIFLYLGIMIYGWGLEVKSWWWIVCGHIAGRVLLGLAEKANKENP